MIDHLIAIQQQYNDLLKENARLKAENDRLKGLNVLGGFRLVFRGNYWQAYRRIDGKAHYVFIGRDKDKAQVKIAEYAKRHGISTLINV